MKHQEKPKKPVDAGGVVIGGFRGKRPISKKVVLLTAVVILAALLLGTAWWVYAQQQKEQGPRYDTSSASYLELTQLQDKPIPQTSSAKVTYYLQLANAYDGLGDSQKALESALQADSFITDRSIETGNTANIAIARYYKALGDKTKAREYYQREIDRIVNDPLAEDNAETIRNIEKLKQEV